MMRRRAWFDWHSWVGLNLSLLMTFVVLTGTLATVSQELDWLATPAMRASSLPAATPPAGTMLAEFDREYPEADATALYFPRERWLAPSLIGSHPEGERFRVFFDAATGEIQGTGPWNNWQRFLRETHRHLMLPLNIGLTVVSLLSIPLLVSFVSSLYVYRRWWRGFFRWPRRTDEPAETPSRRKTRRRFWGDLHRLAGVWSLWFVLLIALTSVWYLVEHLGLNARLPALERSAAAAAEASPRLLETNPRALDRLLAEAKRRHPDLVVRTILPGASVGAVLIRGQANTLLVRDRANHVAFDGHTGELRDVRRGEELDWHNRISEAADPLHFGYFGGPLTRYVWFVFGALMTALSISGVYLFGLRMLGGGRMLRDVARAAWRTAVNGVPRRLLAPQGVLVIVSLCLATGRYLLA